MSKKPESRLQLRIRRSLKKEVGGYWCKIWGGPFQQSGLPDILGCVEGLFFGFEVKVPGNEPTELQEIEIGLIKRAGGCAAVVTTPEQAVKLVRQTLARAKKRR